MKPPVSHRLSSSTPDRVNIFLPAALIAVNNSVSLSPLSLPFQLLLRWCMFFFFFHCGGGTSSWMRSGCPPAFLLWSPQASEDRFNRDRKQFIARVATPLIQPHESSRAHPGETPGKVPVPSTRCGRILGREEGRETPRSLRAHLYACVCEEEEREAHICRAVAV